MSNIIDSIQLSGTTYQIQGSGGNNVVELTQAQYDALVDKDPTAFYIITDATAGDLTQYWTSAQTQSAITSATSGKVDTSTYNTYTAATDTVLNGKQATLVSGTNIKTINNESLLGSGNIVIQGGGSTYSAGTGIDITDNVISASFYIESYGGDDYKGLNFASNGSSIAYVDIPLYGGIVSDNHDGRLSTKMQSTPYQWLSADTSESYASSKFSVPSSAITFDMSRNPSEMLRWCSNDSCFSLIDSNGDNADPNSFSIVNDNGHVTVIALTDYNLIEQLIDDSGELDQYVSNLQYWGCEYDTIPNVVNTKQTTLTAGTGISIIDNVISATGGGGGSSYTAGDGIDITNDVISVTGKADTSAVTAIQDSLSGYVTTDTAQDITAAKTFLWSDSNKKPIIFKQRTNNVKLGFVLQNSASTNNELATFELRPNTFTIDGVQHPLLYFGHYRNTNTANAGVPQTVVGFRQYDQLNAAAYHYLMPLPEKAKTPFSLTTTFKDYYAPMGFKNGSTMITADDTGVVDLSSELGGLKLKKLTQAEYDALASKDNSTLYVIVN